MNPGLARLKKYPFTRLNAAFKDLTPPASVPLLDMSIGEPRQQPPKFILDALQQALPKLANYPTTSGLDKLRQAQAGWLERRLNLAAGTVNPQTQVLPVNGTREALFSFAQCVLTGAAGEIVCMANPYYQIYEGAALLAGANCHFINRYQQHGFAPDYAGVDSKTWQQCRLLYICSPDNPTGQCIDQQSLATLLTLADKYDFVIAADECYLDIYPDEKAPPQGVLGICHQLGRTNYERVMSFNSLSKRSGVPGLRSGFVAGDAELIKHFLAYRTYHGSAMPLPTQYASIAAWNDDQHTVINRELYRQRFKATLELLADRMQCQQPQGGFYLWAQTPGDDLQFARKLYRDFNLKVLPGRLLSQPDDDTGPGAGYIRVALVAELEDCILAAQNMLQCMQHA